MSKYVDLILVVLAIISVALLIYELDHPEAHTVTSSIDMVIAFFFLAEYIHSTYRAPNRKRYALTHCYDVLASLPIPTSSFRMVRELRLLRLIRLMRLMRFNRAARFFGESGVGHVITVSIIIFLMGGIGFFILESHENPNLQSSFDGIYWALTTIASVGYGDIAPVTTMGKVLAMILMIAGVGAYGCLAGFIGGHLARGSSSPNNKDKKEQG